MRGSEGGDWKRVGIGNSLVAYPTLWGGGSQQFMVKSCDTLEPKGKRNGEYKADLITGGVLATRRLSPDNSPWVVFD